MEKKKWLWKRKSSERSPGDSESSGSVSFSSPSERYSDEQDISRESPNGSIQSPEITSKLSFTDDEVKENVKRLTEKLSAALVNVSAKEELVKQHAKVAEEAVAGWEKAENEVAALKQQLEAAVQQNLNLEVRVSHLDGALKECVRQLRQGRDEQEKRISDAIAEKHKEWESVKVELEKQILQLQTEATQNENSASVNTESFLLIESIEKENSFLKQELKSRCKELESVAIERDLSIQAAETASKLQLESIKKVAKLEAECRRLQALARKSSPLNSSKPATTSSLYAESLTDSYSDSGERLNATEIDTSNVDRNGSEPSCSDSWASALIAELDQFKNEKLLPRSLTTCSVEFDMMDDFLEMERLAALPDNKSNAPFAASESASGESISTDNPLRAELDSMIQRVAELEKKLEKMEAEKAQLQTALDESEGSLKAAHNRIAEAETKLEEVQKELKAVNEAKESLESHLIVMEVEARTMSANVDLLNAEIEKERTLSAELSVKCQELENDLNRTVQESVLQRSTSNSNGELKIKQEDLVVAADKLAECQKTIASLGMQLKSLATLEDFLIDTSNIPGFHSTTRDKPSSMENGNSEESSAPAPSAGKSRNGFGKFFSRSKSGAELSNRHE